MWDFLGNLKQQHFQKIMQDPKKSGVTFFSLSDTFSPMEKGETHIFYVNVIYIITFDEHYIFM